MWIKENPFNSPEYKYSSMLLIDYFYIYQLFSDPTLTSKNQLKRLKKNSLPHYNLANSWNDDQEGSLVEILTKICDQGKWKNGLVLDERQGN